MNDPFSLDGKVALITGASRGLGWAMARAMARAGARVVLNGRYPDTLVARVAELAGEGLAAASAPFDVADADAVVAGIAGIVAENDRLDVLISNAGINHRDALDEFAVDDWRRVIDTNLTACFILAREASRPMVAQGAGRIVMTGSIMGAMARPTIPAYVAAKGGVAAFTRALAAELGPKGVTCNAIAPGYIATEMTADLHADPAFREFVEARTPLGRWGEADEIGSVAVFLASDAASYVNGHVLTVDGGLTATL